MKNKRDGKDYADLYGDYWDGIKTGVDDYPILGRQKKYQIAGGKKDDVSFKAEMIEVFGVKYWKV